MLTSLAVAIGLVTFALQRSIETLCGFEVVLLIHSGIGSNSKPSIIEYNFSISSLNSKYLFNKPLQHNNISAVIIIIISGLKSSRVSCYSGVTLSVKYNHDHRYMPKSDCKLFKTISFSHKSSVFADVSLSKA